ncbi:MAG: Calx-beta domain-containing protein, partial [Bacteroidota bacterium]
MKTLTINNLLLRCALLSACFLLSAISTAQTTFTESSALYGLNIGDDKDGGHAWADYDLDGDLDLLINRYTSSVLLKNQLIETGSISFVDVTASLTNGMNTQRERSAIFADFNNDGYPDFARNTSFDGIEVRLQHPATHVFGDGNGGTQPYIYDDIASATAYISDGVNTEGMVAFDFDQDGDLDIAFDNHDYGIDLLINSGNGVFTHGTPKGPGYDQNDPATWPLGLAQDATDGDYSSGTDYDNDGLVDIISRKRDEVDFFRNTGGAFSTTSIDIDQADNNNKGGISFYDFDNDGDFDLFWTENGTNQIHENQNGTYVPLGSSTGIPTQFSGDTIEGLACGDIDNDGDIDIFLAGKDGYLYINQINSSAGANTGSPMQFVRDTSTNFFNGIGNGEGCTFVDIDRDGDLDLYANKSQGANELYINNLSNANSDKYLFVDIIENRDLYNLTGIEQRYAVGATARIVSCEGVVISGLREVNGGNGHGTQDPQRIHFGLPYGADQEFIVEVFFPTGPDGRKVIKYSFVPNTLGTGWERVAVFTPDMETPNGAPVAVDDTYEYPNDTDTVIINPVENDTDPESEPVQILSIEQPDHGSAVLNGDGTISFTPELGYCGPSVMNYTAEDIASCRIFSKTDTATITLTINTTPEANDDTYVIQEDVPNNSFDVLDNDDFKCDGPQANTTITNLGAPANGGVTLNNNGTPSNPLDDYLVYTPNPYFNGNDSFTYEITDGNGTVDTATVNVTVNPDTNKNLEILTNAISVDEGIGIATITVRITGTYQVGPTINFTTSDNSATAGADYTAVSDSHTFVGNDGELFDIEIPILDDTLIENSEIIDIQVGSTSYSTPIDLATDITITDNDGGSGNGITVSDFTVDEDAGTASFDVSLNADVQGGFAVDFAITDGSALAGSDYTASASGTLNFVGNNTEVQSVTVTILDDTVIEGVEDLSISLSGLTTTLITILDGNATGTINDNDGGSGNGITVSDFTVDEDAGTAT